MRRAIDDASGGVKFVEAPVRRYAAAKIHTRETVQAFWHDLAVGYQAHP